MAGCVGGDMKVSSMTRDVSQSSIEVQRRGAVIRFVRTSILTGLLVGLLVGAGRELAVRRLPAGEAYVLVPHGWGAVLEFVSEQLFLGFGAMCVTAAAFTVRPWLRITFRVVCFLLFGVFMTWYEANLPIAVVRDPAGFLLVRSYPLSPRRLTPRQIENVSIRRVRMGREMAITLKPGEPLRYIRLEGVWDVDPLASQAFDRLVAALHSASSVRI